MASASKTVAKTAKPKAKAKRRQKEAQHTSAKCADARWYAFRTVPGM